MSTQDERSQEEQVPKTKKIYSRGVLPPFKPRQLTDEEIEDNLEELHNERFSNDNIHIGRWGNVTQKRSD